MIEILTYYNGSKVSEIRTSGTLEEFARHYPNAVGDVNWFKVHEPECEGIYRTLVYREVDDD